MKHLVILLLVLSCILAKRKSFNGHKMYRMFPATEEQIETLSLLYDNTNFDFWTAMRGLGQAVDVSVSGRAQPSFENLARQLNLTYEEHIPNLDRAINRERKELADAPRVEKGSIDFVQYHRYGTIVDYLENLAKSYANIVSLEKIGKSVQGRDILAVKISTDPNGSRPTILIDAGLSPREWIGPAQALFIIHSLVEVSTNAKLIQNLDWYVIPVVNPDGYEYTHTTNRLWRKNRSKGKEEIGTYINRNFDINWGVNHTSSLEIDWMYHGPKPFSEPETVALKTLIEDHADQIKLYLSLHSFGPNIVYPFGYTQEPHLNVQIMRSLAAQVSEAIKSIQGTSYRPRPASSKYYLFSGSSVDWAVAKMGIEYAYTIELPSPGFTGFDFPVHKISSVVQEIFAGIKVFHKYIEDRFVHERIFIHTATVRDEL